MFSIYYILIYTLKGVPDDKDKYRTSRARNSAEYGKYCPYLRSNGRVAPHNKAYGLIKNVRIADAVRIFFYTFASALVLGSQRLH